VSRLEKLLAALAVLPFGLGFTVGAGAPAEDEVVFAFADPAIIESSGLAVEDGLFATVNDSGDSARVFTVDPADGRTVAVTAWGGEPEDVEAIALLPGGDLLVGDIGDNTMSRDSVELVRVPFGHDGSVEPTSYELAYPDGPHDAEALLVHPQTGQVLVVAKEFIGRLYAAPAKLDDDGANELELVSEDVQPIATDGAFFPDGRTFVLRGYSTATFYRWPSLERIDDIPLPDQEQGEGIAVGPDGQVFVSSEGQHSEVLRIALPQWLRDRIDRADEAGPTARPDDDGGKDRGKDRDGAADAQPLDGGGEGVPVGEERPVWPWALGGLVGVVILAVLLRSLRPR
jgi:hypothetical protein